MEENDSRNSTVAVGIGKKCWGIIETIVQAVLTSVFRLMHRELTDEMSAFFMQFVKFGLIGVTNTAVSYAINIIALLCFRKAGMSPDYDYLVAQLAAFIISVAWSFYWNNKLVFTEEREQRIWWKALIKTYISYSFACVFLNSILSWIWITVFGISKLIAPVINLVIDVPVNFLINKFWAFRADRK